MAFHLSNNLDLSIRKRKALLTGILSSTKMGVNNKMRMVNIDSAMHSDKILK